MSVDLEQAAVILLCHLDRLAVPHSPPLHTPHGRPTQGQEVRLKRRLISSHIEDIDRNFSLENSITFCLILVDLTFIKNFYQMTSSSLICNDEL